MAQAIASYVWGLSVNYKWMNRILIGFVIVLLFLGFLFAPAATGESVNEGLFTGWRWLVTIPAFAAGILSGILEKKLREKIWSK